MNAHSGVEITLKHLTRSQKEFYTRALELFRANTSWLQFEEFAFGPRSPLYEDRESHLAVLKDPLYQALEDMWLELGVQQGAVKRRGKNEGRPEDRRRTAEEAADREEADNLATTR